MADKTLKFQQTTDGLIDAGDRFFSDGNYPNAADCYYRAYLKNRKNDDVMVRLAKVYRQVGDNVLAIEWYIRAINENSGNLEAYPGLVEAYADIGPEMRDMAYYYFALGRSYGVVTPQEIDEIAELEEMDEEESELNDGDMRLISGTNDALKFQRGKEFLKENALSAAYVLFASVARGDPHYKEARRMMMKIDVEREDYKSAAQISEQLLEEDPDDTQALIFGSKAYHELGNLEKRDEFFRHAEIDSNSTIDDMETAAEVAWYMKEYETALKYLVQLKRLLPYDRNILLKTALCNANLGDSVTAKTEIIETMRLYPDDLALKYYAEKISKPHRADFLPIDTVPEEEAIRREDALDDWLLAKGTLGAVSDGFKKDEDMREYLDWLFQEGDTGLQLNVARFLSQSKRWKTYLEQLLIIPSVSAELKKAILSEMFYYNDFCEIAVTTGQLYRRIRYEAPEGLCNRALDAYIAAFVSMTFFCDGFVEDLNEAFSAANERIEKMQEDDEETDIAALAAAVCKVCKVGGETLSYPLAARLFDCDEKKLKRYATGKGVDLKGLPKKGRNKK